MERQKFGRHSALSDPRAISSILDLRSSILGLLSSILDLHSSILDLLSSILGLLSSILDHRFSITVSRSFLDPRSTFLDPRSTFLDPRSPFLDHRSISSILGHRSLILGLWFLCHRSSIDLRSSYCITLLRTRSQSRTHVLLQWRKGTGA